MDEDEQNEAKVNFVKLHVATRMNLYNNVLYQDWKKPDTYTQKMHIVRFYLYQVQK